MNIYKNGAYLINGENLISKEELKNFPQFKPKEKTAYKNTISYHILKTHNTNKTMTNLQIKFDALASHDITFVGIIQTAIASGLHEFPIPYILTNCHNSLCAVGGTINEDDHIFGYSAAKKFGGIFVPPHQAVIHQFMREMYAGCGKMILGSDSHTRYGALGTIAIGEGGGELVKQLLNHTYNIQYPKIVAVYLKGTPVPGVGPQDIALSIIGKVFSSGYVKNKIMEFVGPGIKNLSMDFRNGIDVMTTETTCLSSIWCTDSKTKEFLKIHGRESDFKEITPDVLAYYDGALEIDLTKIKPMIAMPFHPSNIYTIDEVNENTADILNIVEKNAKNQLANKKLNLGLQNKIIDGHFKVDQGVIAGCAGGTFENIINAANILKVSSVGDFPLSIYPASQPISLELLKNHAIEDLVISGATIRTAFCGPCFGAGDVPANQGFSIRHTTRNFPNREGSKPNENQIASVALMDARSIAATAKNNGYLTAAKSSLENIPKYNFNSIIYKHKIYNGYLQKRPNEILVSGPNIVPWPKIKKLSENLLLTVCAVIHDPITTTDELIPSGETSSYRSNPLRLAEFTLSRKVPGYVNNAKNVQKIENLRQKYLNGNVSADKLLKYFPSPLKDESTIKSTGIGSVIFSIKPGDGSAREQAASCQKVLGTDANIAIDYATKRYRSNLINWGIIPFTIDKKDINSIHPNDQIYIKGILDSLLSNTRTISVVIFHKNNTENITLHLDNISNMEREILSSGCLINYYSNHEQ
ncbi:hydratase [Pectinatus frisingensis]|uniref:hydratase n=1 Tax=Pectinatus frisingensis TaxID=865 RepID=UPI0018C75751|nr:hydratase [Pectinatus frisingensis]